MLPYDRKRAFRKQWLYLGTFLTVIFLTVTNLEMVAEVLRSGRKLGAGWTESYILKVLTGDGIRLYFPLLCTVPYATGFVDEYKSGIYKFVLVRKERKKCTVDVPGLQTDKSLFLGNIEGGTAVSGELDAFAGVVNAEEETTEKRYGRTDGRILLTYEDEDGNSYEETSDIVLTIQPLKIEEKNTDKNEKESNKIGRQFLIGVTAVVGLGIVGVVLPGWIRRRKQGQFYE